jgi:hypothetical protein
VIAHLYQSGDAVAVFDTRRGRWIQANVVDATLRSALVQTARWWGLVPVKLMRPMCLVGLA